MAVRPFGPSRGGYIRGRISEFAAVKVCKANVTGAEDKALKLHA